MTSRDFCYWLQGFFEINQANGPLGGLSPEQAAMVQKHLHLVFKHEIDPTHGSAEHQAKLDAVHNDPLKPNLTVRC